MYSFAIFAAERSLRNVMKIDRQLHEFGQITYLPYSSPDHLIELYSQQHENFDALLFSGSYPYSIILRKFGALQKPSAYFHISDRDYYKLIARLAVQKPDLDFARVYMDYPEFQVDFQDIFGRSGVPLLGSAGIDWQTVSAEDWYYPTRDYYQKIWETGEVDLLVTRFGSMEDYFRENGINYEFLLPSAESMLETVRALSMQLTAKDRHDAASCIGLVAGGAKLTDGERALLKECLESCNKKFGIPFLIYEHGDCFELTTSSTVLKELTQQYTTDPFLSQSPRTLPFSVYIGWGCAGSVIDAHRSAQRAFRQAKLSKQSAAYVVLADNTLVGPLSSKNCIRYSDVPNPLITTVSKKLSISPLYLNKILSVIHQKGENAVTAEELAFYLGITTRSASRILSKLELGGAATVKYNRQLNLRGRPAKVYTIHLPDPAEHQEE